MTYLGLLTRSNPWLRVEPRATDAGVVLRLGSEQDPAVRVVPATDPPEALDEVVRSVASLLGFEFHPPEFQ